MFEIIETGHLGVRDYRNGQKWAVFYPWGVQINIVRPINPTFTKVKFLYYYLFFDKKYKKVSDILRYQWARIYFDMKCDRCRKIKNIGIQGNITRPYSKLCNCGHVLFEERKNPFIHEIEKITNDRY